MNDACVYYLASPFWKVMMEFAYVFGSVTGKKDIPTRPEQKMHKNTLDSQWQKLINRAVDEGLINEKWHFHDLKAKGVSDHEGLVSGHKTLEAKKIYIRKTQEVQGTR
ncbi:hypothetical protein [Endozoicomonas sp. GU-1]|uniref:hypothetical protein n=1 Tax=Endozoicomonas sp. GU-1 TaxID=3009078 RepID=UPI0022B5A94E|nr:hypothetical protein [Endozoicomonas sp. GU-1]WBA81451.1 hypothetical protein O2T12_24770 [Endozoicomonas sp. GU-1]WBA84398.1 hypothetical protein O3276_13930 [Endozoicomonas sp. GU-1]